MKFTNCVVVLILFLGTVVAWPIVGIGVQETDSKKESAQTDEPVLNAEKPQESKEDKFKPVDNMHHFMEYISKPSYMELRKILAKEKVSRGEWKKVKQHSLILSETSKLVSERGPADKDQNAEWKKLAFETYQQGAALYKAAGSRKLEVAVKHYGAMMDACNQCHKKFDPKNHQLAK